MIVYISGDKYLTDIGMIAQAIAKSGFKVTRIISNGETGASSLARMYGEASHIPVDIIKADWKDITVEGAVIKTGKWGQYNSRAAINRDEEILKKSQGYIGIQLTEDDSCIKFDKMKFERAGKDCYIHSLVEKKAGKGKKKYDF